MKGIISPICCFFIAAALLLISCERSPEAESESVKDAFMRATTVGKSYYEGGDAEKAIQSFQKALALHPNSEDALLNLANAYLLADQTDAVIETANKVLELNPSSAAAYYLIGCAYLRQQDYEEALKALQTSERIQPNDSADAHLDALTYQIGRAHYGLGQWEDAIQRFEELTQFVPDHPAAWYNLSQALIRVGREEEAQQALEQHQQALALNPNASTDVAALERCRHTEIRLEFDLAQPDPEGLSVTFNDATQKAFGENAATYGGPFGVLDSRRIGVDDLLVSENGNRFQLLVNSNGVFRAAGEPFAGIEGAHYSKILIGDVSNQKFDATDSYEDAIILGDQSIHLLRFATNATYLEQTAFVGLKDVKAVDGMLMDLNSDGFLDLTVVPPDRRSLKVYENLGPPYFVDKSATSGIPSEVTAVTDVTFDDWNGDDMMDVFLAHADAPPTLLLKQRGGPLVATNAPAQWKTSRVIALGDMNNNLRVDMVTATESSIDCLYSRLPQSHSIPLNGFEPTALKLIDYDNDGWLDIFAAGNGLRVWRNLGNDGFQDVTAALKLDTISGTVEHFEAADFDGDCDLDLVVSLAGEGVRYFESQGTNANRMLKVRLAGTRSNRSGIGVRLLTTAGRWHSIRTIKEPLIEFGVGPVDQVDSLDVRWFDASEPKTELSVASCEIYTIPEITRPTGSCPYLYRWNGEKYEFITDLLGSAPLGLPMSQQQYLEADTREYVWIGSESMFPPNEGYHVLQVTEELREVLYLDEAKLVVVDHPAGTEVYSTSKLVPGKPWPDHRIVTLHREHPLLKATNQEGSEVTDRLRAVDEQMVSPSRLAIPQMRGRAEPFAVTLDFGEIDVNAPLVLVMNGWLRFGGGMANIASSLYPEMPYPFPVLEAETAPDHWEKVDVVVGAPAGKTKTIVADLAGKLPEGTRRLRLGTAFEIHWDRIALMEKYEAAGETQIASIAPAQTDLHWRGFSEFQDLPDDLPQTPDYEQVYQTPKWVITPAGWCTKYGDVSELIASSDNALALMNGGDELTLKFAEDQLPRKPAGFVRDFFFYNVGWDKDADFHVAAGWTVGPLPWHGMDYQRYGRQPRPSDLSQDWIKEYNTRWIGPKTLTRK